MTLTAVDRCDRCGARALARATKGTAELLLCGHHANQNVLLLANEGWEVEREVPSHQPVLA